MAETLKTFMSFQRMQMEAGKNSTVVIDTQAYNAIWGRLWSSAQLK